MKYSTVGHSVGSIVFFATPFGQERRIQSVACRTSEQEVVGAIPGLTNFVLTVDASRCDWIDSSLTADHYFNNDCLGKQLVAWKECCTIQTERKLLDDINRCSDRGENTKIFL